MTPNYEVITAIVGLVSAGVFIGKQLAKVLSENAENIKRDLKIQSLEKRMNDVEEEQLYYQRHRDKN